MARESSGLFSIRKSANGCSIGLPREFGEKLPEGQLFAPELVDEGILLRPVERRTVKLDDLPAWAQSA